MNSPSANLSSAISNPTKLSKKALNEQFACYQLASYITRRVATHGVLYRERIEDVPTSIEPPLFRVLFFAVMNSYHRGHTVQEYAQSDQSVIQALVDSQRQQLDALLVDTKALFDMVCGTDNAQLATKVSAFCAEQQKHLALLGIRGHLSSLIIEYIKDVARVYWWAHQQGMSDDTLVHKLSTNCFVNMIIGCAQVLPRPTDDAKSTQADAPCANLDKPLVVTHNQRMGRSSLLVWLQRAYQAEWQLATQLLHLSAQTDAVIAKTRYTDILADYVLNDEQRQAIITALSGAFTLITGGPGTGKTYTIAHLVLILSALYTDDHAPLQLALVAPTGKAAKRMQESLQATLRRTGTTMHLPESKTIHRLLGIGRDGKARHNAQNPLQEDVIIVDEASMLGVELASQLALAIKVGARLILLGDANQLAAVDAGSVLYDLCQSEHLADRHVKLVASKRFDDHSGIGRLAQEVLFAPILNLADPEQAMTATDTADTGDFEQSLLGSVFERFDELAWVDLHKVPIKRIYEQLSLGFDSYIALVNSFINTPIPNDHGRLELFEMLNRYRILCSSHQGELGDDAINLAVSYHHLRVFGAKLWTQGDTTHFDPTDWYHGRPIMILKNDYTLGLHNGDVGICLGVNEPLVYFEHLEHGISPALLNDDQVSTSYAMTIHKSQGSEFDHVAITLDNTASKLLTKELIYTAITRAKLGLSVVSTASALLQAVHSVTVRHTGLTWHLSTDLVH